ncbi:exodeoxyribonuclease VII large subunit [Corynebacterium choanae]
MIMVAASAPTSLERPWAVETVNQKIRLWIAKLGKVWVEGELTEIRYQPNWASAFAVLRDSGAEASIRLRIDTRAYTQSPVPLTDGMRVVVLAKPEFFVKRGELSLWVEQVHHLGAGDLQARIDLLRGQLAREGLFDQSRKQRLPMVPKSIGLITGDNSHAMRDVIEVATRRWPEVHFTIINTPVQGAAAAPAIIRALGQLDENPDVDVIVIARGGGSVEDLLPFSEESLIRAVYLTETPVVSAIGHEPDRPILDEVADVRAATPTDAAKTVAPDAFQERAMLADMRQRSAAALRGWVDQQSSLITAIRSRPVLARPLTIVEQQRELVSEQQQRARRAIAARIAAASAETLALRARVEALGPAATLARGYSVVQVIDRETKQAKVVTSIEQAPPGAQLRIRVSDGSISAAGIHREPAK